MDELKNIDEVLTGTIFVDVWAPWCTPCTTMAPIFSLLEGEFENIKFMKCNMDDMPDFGRKYKIKSIPTFLLFEDGVVKDQISGISSIQRLRNILNG
jgi:thioredoxin